jgi:hypothetical protein
MRRIKQKGAAKENGFQLGETDRLQTRMASKRHKRRKTKVVQPVRQHPFNSPTKGRLARLPSVKPISYYAPFVPFCGNLTAAFRINGLETPHVVSCSLKKNNKISFPSFPCG